jgi:integrase
MMVLFVGILPTGGKSTNMNLTNIQCKKAAYNPSGVGNKLSDGGGLILHIKENGKYWRLNYRFLGMQKTLALGVYPRVSLAEARERREEAKKMIEVGKDPIVEKKIAKIELHTSHENNFEAIAREWHSQKLHTWKPEHAANILKRFESNLFPYIGKRPIKEIRESELLNAIRTLESEGKRDLAHRMLQHGSKIFCYAISTGRATHDITLNLKGALQPVRSKGLAHLKETQLPEFLQKLEKYDTDYKGNLLTKLAFKLLILTFVRSGEIRGAKWEEIDWEKKQWRIPAERMKIKDQPHIVPLSRQSLEILEQLRNITGHNVSGYIFPSQNNPRTTMSENTFLRVIDVMGYKGESTGHGFRSVASTLLNEHQFRRDVIERQLAHAERDSVRKAYNFAEYLPERADMMQWYADKIDELKKKKK